MAGESKTARQSNAAGQVGKASKKVAVDPIVAAVQASLKKHYADFGLFNTRSNPRQAAWFLLSDVCGVSDPNVDTDAPQFRAQVNYLETLVKTQRPFTLDELVSLVRVALTVTLETLTAQELAERIGKTYSYIKSHAAELGGVKVDGAWRFDIITTATMRENTLTPIGKDAA